MNVVKVEKAEPWILDGLNALLPQLSGAFCQLSIDALEAVARAESTTLLVAEVNQQVFGSLTLVIFRVPTGLRARIEDLVVDGSARGQGLGEALVRRAIALAGNRGAEAVELTSSPQRIAANRLYRKIGFVLRETNAYRYAIPGR